MGAVWIEGPSYNKINWYGGNFVRPGGISAHFIEEYALKITNPEARLLDGCGVYIDLDTGLAAIMNNRLETGGDIRVLVFSGVR